MSLELSNLKLEDFVFFLKVRNECAPYLHDNRLFSENECKPWFAKNHNNYLLIKKKHIKVGYVRLTENNKLLKTLTLGLDIDSNFRRQHIAYDTYLALFNHFFIVNEYKCLRLEVLSHNNKAISLYKKLGFRVVKILENFLSREGLMINNILMEISYKHFLGNTELFNKASNIFFISNFKV
jgi:RimJ/RimL family protein N-acetyltransferase